MHHVYTVAVEDQKRVSGFLELELHVVVNQSMWMLETSLGPLEEQFVFFAAKPCFRLSVPSDLFFFFSDMIHQAEVILILLFEFVTCILGSQLSGVWKSLNLNLQQ